jgi:hypothetical protein
MGFLKRFFGGLPASNRSNFYTFTVRCTRCNEAIEGRVNLNNDLSVEYEDGGDVYYVRKVLIGSGMCYQQIEVSLKFDADRRLLKKHIEGGQFIESQP